MTNCNKQQRLSLLRLIALVSRTVLLSVAAAAHVRPGHWQLLYRSIGVSAMHVQLLNNDRVVIFDRTNFGASNISLSAGRFGHRRSCIRGDCTAHAVEYDVVSNTFRPLTVLYDTWCSSGAVAPDGHLIQTGGNVLGSRVVRLFYPCHSWRCDWKELANKLLRERWYATDHILPNGRVIVVGGRGQFNYEFYPKTKSTNTLRALPFLLETSDPVENNLYPFVFLNVDGNLFIFANNRAILLDYTRNVVVRKYPAIPGGEPRSYPSTGSAVLLPLTNLESMAIEVEVLVCGGSPKGSYQLALKNVFLEALDTCARIKINDPNPQWFMETMPMSRCMGDMVLLPNGHVLIINGVRAGTASWDLGRHAALSPVQYDPEKPYGSRFEVLAAAATPRVYHSTAILLRDARVMVGGSNPHDGYQFANVLYPTDLSLEAFSPPYLDRELADLRPKIVAPASHAEIRYRKVFRVRFSVNGLVDRRRVKVTMIPPPFNTHSFSHGQRLLVLSNVGDVESLPDSTYRMKVKTPNSGNIAPAGYYMLFVVHQDIPSEGLWVHVQ